MCDVGECLGFVVTKAVTVIRSNASLLDKSLQTCQDEVLHPPAPPGWGRSTSNPGPLLGDEVLHPRQGAGR
jgi:hypothetical protein